MDRKKRAAAMAAVYACITDAEAAHAMQQTDPATAGPVETAGKNVPAGPGPNIWGLTGRQSMMQANTMMQLRMFK
jgi:hypothetical protein